MKPFDWNQKAAPIIPSSQHENPVNCIHKQGVLMLGRIHSIESFGTVDGPGVRLVVFLQGCPMRCLYCHNPDTWNPSAGTLMEPDEILNRYERNADFYKGGGITVSGGEPLLQLDYVLALFTLAKAKQISTCLDTSGILFCPGDSVSMEKMNRLMEVCDLVMLDIKHIDPDKHLALTSHPNEPILSFAHYLEQQKVPMWIRHVVIPGYTDEDNDLFNLGYFIGQFHCLKALDVLPYHTMGERKYQEIGIPYPLQGVPPLDQQIAAKKKKVILEGLRKRRMELI
jgi:pyruvate formate lyase activating enzyme